MAESLEQYRRMFREAHVEDQHALFGIHVLIYVLANAVWIMLNMIFVPSRYRWLMFYPIIGWGSLVFVHWWFDVRNANKLCRLREEKAVARMIKPAPSE